MSTKDKTKWWSRLHRRRGAASPAPSAAQSPEHESEASSIVTTGPCTPSRGEVQVIPPSIEAGATNHPQPATAPQAPPLTRPVESPPEPVVTESVSERLWNAAYDRLEADDVELVRSYIETLQKVLGSEAYESSVADLSAKLKDPTTRQNYMRKLVQNGQEKISRASRITTGVGDVADFVLSAKAMIDLVLQSVPQAAPAALPWAGVCLGLQILRNPAQATKSNLAGIAHVISRMDWYCALTVHLLNRDNITGGNNFQAVLHQLEQRVIELYKALLSYQMKSICSYYRNQGLIFLRGMFKLDDWDGDLKLVTDIEAVVQNDAAQNFQEQTKLSLGEFVKRAKKMETLLGDIHQDIREFIRLQKEIRMDDKDEKCLQDLFIVDPQHDMKKIEKKKDTLLEGGYNWILDTKEYIAFTNWASDESVLPACRLLWIKGHAGTGKTMLLMGIIRKLSSQPAKLAPQVSHFFCQGTDHSLNTATAALRSLIWLLLVQQPHLISHLQSKYKNAGSSLFKGETAFIALSDAFESMLKDKDLRPVYFIVDALDECEQGLASLIKLISTSLTLTDKVKWLVSGRPTVELKNSATAGSLVELDAQRLEGPVNVYIDEKLSILKTREGYNDQLLAEIAGEVRRRAKNTFLWVALVFKELDTGVEDLNPVHGAYALDIIKEIPPGLSQLYSHMFAKIEKGSRQDPQYCKNVLAAVVLTHRPLTLSELTVVAELPPSMPPRTVTNKCGSFLTVKQETVYLIHQSAKDYLDENYRSRLQPAGVTQGHAEISRRSINAMYSLLGQNMYNLDFGFKPKDLAPPNPDLLAALRYSCVFWADHLCILNGDNLECKRELTDDGAVFKFLKQHFLHWVESLSLLGKLSDGVQSIRKLLYTAQLQPVTNSQLIRFLKHAEKFVLSHGSIIERAPLQIYGSALVFSPNISEVKISQWHEKLPFIKTAAGMRDRWGAHQQTLEGHSDSVRAVAFSPDGKTLASASDDNTIRLWDAATGAHQQTLEGHSDLVRVVAFSPDGKTLASASDDQTIRLWDAATGAHQQTLEGHNDWVWVVAFSPDGKTLASASDDNTIRLWDAATGAYQQTLEGHSDSVWAVVFSPDGKTLASASDDNTIQLWDVATGAHQQTLEGHNDWVWTVVFSPDGKTLASASGDNTIQLWDGATGAHQQTLEGHSGSVWAVVFSPDGKMLASASGDNTIRLWNVATGAHQQTLEGHSGSVRAVAFSPDGKTLASASTDQTIRLWDAATGAYQQTLEGHSDSVWAVVFSPDGKTLASASDDETIRLWDAATGAHQQTLEGHSGSVWAVAFSPDGKTLASASDDNTIRLWDAATGAYQQTLEGHSDSVWAVAFSENGQYLKTNQGIMGLKGGHSNPKVLNTLLNQKPAESCLFVRDDWVVRDGKNLLWLPLEYRAVCVATYGDMLVLGHDSGQVTFLQFTSSH